jgi:tetratricopeptide (TPR) repeat protein
MGLYNRLGRSDKALSLVVSVADLRPNDVRANLRAAALLISDKALASNGQLDRPNLTESDLAQARRYLNRASVLIVEQDGHDYDYGTQIGDSPRLLAAWADWLEGKLPQASADILEAERRSKTLEPQATVGLHASLGELHAAEKRIAAEQWPDIERVMLAYYRGDLVECRIYLSKIHEIKPAFGADIIGIVAAHTGQWKQAQIARQTLLANRDHPQAPTWLHIVDGEIALARGDRRKGIAVLEAALPKLDTGASSSFMAVEDLAHSYQKEGKTENALDVLQKAAVKSAAAWNFSFAWRMRIRLQLAQAYRETGRTQDAEKIESMLKKDLTIADPDHPILISLNRRQNATLTRQ